MKKTSMIGASNTELKALVDTTKTADDQHLQYRHIRSLSNNMTKQYLRGRMIHVSTRDFWSKLNSQEFEKPVIKNSRVVRGEDGKIVRQTRMLTKAEMLKMVNRYHLTLLRAMRRKLGVGQPGFTYIRPVMVNHPE